MRLFLCQKNILVLDNQGEIRCEKPHLLQKKNGKGLEILLDFGFGCDVHTTVIFHTDVHT